jgi:murein DD-endopeptidase MepM/ murein hydrolase activator NlpD
MKKTLAIAVLLTTLASGQAAFSDSKEEYLKLNDQIGAKKQLVKDLQKQIDASQSQIGALQNAEATLDNQIAILDNQIAKNSLDIQSAQAQIDQTTLEVQELDAQITDATTKIESDRSLLGGIIGKIGREDERGSILTLFLADDLSAIFARAKSLKDLQGDLLTTVQRIQEERAALEQKHAESQAKNEELRKQKDQLAVEQIKLTDARESKQALMDATHNSESKFRNLVDQLRGEEAGVSSDIASLEAQAQQKLKNDDRFPTGDVLLSWPVPSHSVSTGFHDPDYPFRRIMEHPAIDIAKTPQGTPVHAAAPGYVLKVRDAGYGYSYIILLHAGGISTVYGHLSREVVQEDAFVNRGDVIGYSGGMPGTRGAGNMTTGPHLHFEVRASGIPTDPMDYLVD